MIKCIKHKEVLECIRQSPVAGGEEPLDRLGAYNRSKRPPKLVSEEWGFTKRHENTYTIYVKEGEVAVSVVCRNRKRRT